MSYLRWSHNIEHQSSCLLSKIGDAPPLVVIYKIIKYCQYSQEDVSDCKWAIMRLQQEDYRCNGLTVEELDCGYLGRWKGEVGIICGFGLACAIGLPDYCVFDDLQECKKIYQENLINLINRKYIVHIENKEFAKENLTGKNDNK